MIVLGIILLVVGFLLKIQILWTIGIVVLVIGLVLLALGSMGRAPSAGDATTTDAAPCRVVARREQNCPDNGATSGAGVGT
jgi:hypothetical protein